MIHPTAVIHPKAQVDPTAEVGPYAVIDEHVVLGPNCRVGPHVHITGHTTIGSGNQFFSGAVIGEAPQDVRYKGAPTRVRIGSDNLFREHVTVHRSNSLEEDTQIGSRNFLMAHAHVGHNAQIGNDVILASGVLLAGHSVLQDRAFLSGNCMVHQFVRIGTLALMQGGGGATKDVPPFTVIHQLNGLCGLNVIGLRRAGYPPEQRMELKKLYRLVFLSGQNIRAAVQEARTLFQSEPARLFLDFIASSKRGVCAHSRRAPEAEE